MASALSADGVNSVATAGSMLREPNVHSQRSTYMEMR
jgi:hypothetical protein